VLLFLSLLLGSKATERRPGLEARVGVMLCVVHLVGQINVPQYIWEQPNAGCGLGLPLMGGKGEWLGKLLSGTIRQAGYVFFTERLEGSDKRAMKILSSRYSLKR